MSQFINKFEQYPKLEDNRCYLEELDEGIFQVVSVALDEPVGSVLDPEDYPSEAKKAGWNPLPFVQGTIRKMQAEIRDMRANIAVLMKAVEPKTQSQGSTLGKDVREALSLIEQARRFILKYDTRDIAEINKAMKAIDVAYANLSSLEKELI